MNTRLLALAATGLIAGAAFAVMLTGKPSAPPPGTAIVTESGKAEVGGPFALTDQTGKRVTEKDFLGRYMLVFFGFTNCPDICPAGLQVMTAALDKLGAKAEQVTPVFITIDPARDTTEKLAAYAKSFHPKLVTLTGSDTEIAAAVKAYRVYVQKVTDDKNPTSYTFDHASLFYLMGKDGAFIAPVPHTTDANDIAKTLDKYVQ
jgi:protein SCO1